MSLELSCSFYIGICLVRNWMSQSDTLLTYCSEIISSVLWVLFGFLEERIRKSKVDAESTWGLFFARFFFFLVVWTEHLYHSYKLMLCKYPVTALLLLIVGVPLLCSWMWASVLVASKNNVAQVH